MPKIESDTPKHLRPFIFHGVDLQWGEERSQATGECPFCGKNSKFYLGLEKGLWNCKSCGVGSENGGGNIYTFLRILWENSDQSTIDYEELRQDRGLLYPETLFHWNVARSILTGHWLLATYNQEGSLNQLYQYQKLHSNGKNLLLATSEVPHGMHGLPLFDANKPYILCVEGPWDGMILWETLQEALEINDTLATTSDPTRSLGASCNVVAAPGCNVWNERWCSLFADKTVYLIYDNDHPKEHPKTGHKTQSGLDGMKRVAKLLLASPTPPKEVFYCRWGEEGQPFNPELKDGYDLRDLLSPLPTMEERVQALDKLFKEHLVTIPDEWKPSTRTTASASTGTGVDCIPCSSYSDVANACRIALTFHDGLEHALACCFASVMSTTSIEDDQLWLMMIGPPSSGKTFICEGLSTNSKYVYAMSVFRGFHSGFGQQEGEDHSLLSLIRDRTFVVKDGDTLLEAPNKSQILSEARDAYDKTSRTFYRNGVSRQYNNLPFTFILSGTNALRDIDESELGQRFLSVVIMEGIDPELEGDINRKKFHRMTANRGRQMNCKPESQAPEALINAKRIVGGYVDYLRQNAEKILEEVIVSSDLAPIFDALAKFVAVMRARPSKRQDESDGREMSPRLLGQLTQLGICLTGVLNKQELDKEVLTRVARVALNSARGQTLEIAKILNKQGVAGVDPDALAVWLNESPEKTGKLLRFLSKIKVIERFKVTIGQGMEGRPRWRLSDWFRGLFQEVKKLVP